MYFPHAYQKMLVGTGGFSTKKTQDTVDLVAGEIGIIDNKTNKILDIAATPTYNGSPLVYLAQGSFRASDKLGQFHGGYQETVKSKGINPKYVSRFFVTEPAAATANKITIGYDAPATVACNTTFHLRVEAKGSPVLRTLTRNAYFHAPAFTGCCAEGDAPVSIETVYRQWAQEINYNVIINKFILAELEYFVFDDAPEVDAFVSQGIVEPTVWAATPDAEKYVKLNLSAAYVDTKFSDCSFSKTDHVEVEPLQVYASAVDESGSACSAYALGAVTELVAGKQGKGYGEVLLRDLILSKSYAQEFFHDDNNRLRQVEGDTSLTEINRNASYFTYNILHSVPRVGNPSGMLDSDQYLVKIVVSARSTAFETWINALLGSSGNAARLEVVI